MFDYETENVVAELKVLVPRQWLRQMELYLSLFPKTNEARLVDENGSVMAWIRSKPR